MAVRAIYKDEYQQKKYTYGGLRYHHIEHARWAALWNNLGISFDYKPRRHEINIPQAGTYLRGEDDDTVFYSPHFYLEKLDVYVDIKKEPPKADSKFAACDLFRQTGVPVVIFQGPMFSPNWTTFSPPATFCREQASPQVHYLQYDGRMIRIAPNVNENDVMHGLIKEAFARALAI